jgi:hypothetical protein
VTELRKKPVIRHSIPIGEASTWDEVEALLVASGLSHEDAKKERKILGVEGPDGFYILAPGTEAELCAGVRAAKGSKELSA